MNRAVINKQLITIQSLQITTPGKLEIIEHQKYIPKDNEVLIKVMASGICGTDIHILQGEYMGQYPVIPGHEFAGIVEAVGVNVKRIKLNDKVAVEPNIACDNCWFCLNNKQNFCENWAATGVTLPGGMAQYVVVPEKAVFNIGQLDFEEGAFVEPLSCVLHGIQKLNISLANKILLLGAGPIGILLLQSLKLQGAGHITVVEVDKTRAVCAYEFGADTVFNSLQNLQSDYYDIVIDATGVLKVMNQTLNWAKKGGKILLFGVPPKQNIELNAFDMFLKGITILTSFTSVRNSYQAVELLAQKRLNVKALISHRLSLTDFQKGVNYILKKENNIKKIIILPNS
jgi:D-arabinitol dehydrogenase (NADP+)